MSSLLSAAFSLPSHGFHYSLEPVSVLFLSCSLSTTTTTSTTKSILLVDLQGLTIDGYGAGDNDLFTHHVLPPPPVKWQTFRFVNSHNRARSFYSQWVPSGKPFPRRSLSGCSPSVRLFMKAKPCVSSKSPALFLNKYVLKKITIYFYQANKLHNMQFDCSVSKKHKNCFTVLGSQFCIFAFFKILFS